MLAERVLGAVIGEVLVQIGLAAATPSAPSSSNESGAEVPLQRSQQILLAMGISQKMIDLGSALQAADRTQLLYEAFDHDGINQEKLEKVKGLFSSSTHKRTLETSIKEIDPHPWIGRSPDLTKQAQATTEVVRLFADIVRYAEETGHKEFYHQPQTQEAIKAIGELAYIHRKEVADQFAIEAKNKSHGSDTRKKYQTAADMLHKELDSIRISKFARPKETLFGAVFRGISHGLEFLGYRKDGTARSGGGIFRWMSHNISSWGYDFYDGAEQAALKKLVISVKGGIDTLAAAGHENDMIARKDIYDWLAQKAQQIGVGSQAVGLETPAEDMDAKVLKSAKLTDAEQQHKATEATK